MKLKACGAAAFAAALTLSGCAASGSSGDGNEPYKLGAMIPLTGPIASVTQTYRDGIQLAVDQINKAGGIDGVKLAVSFEDTKGTAEGGVQAMNKLINLEQTPMVISAASAPTLSAQPIARQTDNLLVTVGSVSPGLLNLDNLYVNAVNLTRLGPLLAEELYDQGHREVAFLSQADPFGEGSRDAFTPAWEKLGGTVVEDQTFPPSGGDVSGQLLKIREAGPDVIVVTAIGEVLGQVVKQARAAGLDAPLAGPLATGGLITAAGKAAEGYQDVALVLDEQADSESAVQFREGFTALEKGRPSWDNGTAYEAVHLYKQLIETAIEQGKDPRDGSVLNDLIANARFDDVLQGRKVTFLPDHSVSRAVGLRTVENGAFVVNRTVVAE
ncbi:ABC transporter substrate-binding protein [Qaidamihabitans albus]|uniref:ABC transporter substrate-binding protein n=1 Tax=Qaidamihabitans albus TaxID=2795733 RepID=UPI0018F20D61|nr:ABC transporter substrate-binding protein [Qaidamihabitans albus]